MTAALVVGHSSVALEVHWHARDGGPSEAVLAVCCPVELRASVEAAVRTATPNGEKPDYYGILHRM